MLTRSAAVAREQVIRSREEAHIQPKRPLLVSLTLLAFLVSALLVFGVVTAARAQTAPQMPDLPQTYLPDNSLPKDVSCYRPGDERIPRCSIRFGENEAYFSFDEVTSTITQTLIPAHDYTIGEIVAAWGRPTGITRKQTMVYVHWGTRSALLYTNDFQPNNPVEFIQYDLEPLSASQWRGFRLFE